MFLERIIVYPIKSLDGVDLQETRVTAGGILEFDRIHAIVDEKGAYVNGKRTPKIQLLRSEFSPDFREIRIGLADDAPRRQFSLAEPAAFNHWLSDFFGFTVMLTSEGKSGFPDDRGAPGPTITSKASLEQVAAWYDGAFSLESARRRFRSNLELAGVEPFWEDHLYGKPGELKPFQIGDVPFHGHNPCQRCVVPVRDPDRAEPIPNFQKIFMERRRATLPPWAEKERFNHFYRFAINTSIPEGAAAGKVLRVGDRVQIN
jgi:uncharacterized protein YcbX